MTWRFSFVRIVFQLLFLAALLLSANVRAELPFGAQVMEAETFTLSGKGWTSREHEPGAWYAGRPSGNSYLGGQDKNTGTASVSVEIPKAGKYRLWVRYLDMMNYREKNGFRITVKPEPATEKHEKNGEKKGNENRLKTDSASVSDAVMEFDASEKSLRADPEGEKLWGDGFARWVWDSGEFEAPAGKVTLELSKIHTVPVHGCARDVDVMILTEDLNYVPDILDLTPLYVKIRILPEQPLPVGIHIFGKHPYSPYYPPHSNISKLGLSQGINTGLEKAENLLGPGDESPWVNVAPLMAFGGRNQMHFYAMREYSVKETSAFFEVSFSRTPSEDGIMKTVQRRGRGNGLFWSVDLLDFNTPNTELDASAKNLERARSVGSVPGRRPEIFPFFTGMQLSPLEATKTAYKNEQEALREIGISQELFRPSCFYFHATEPRGCLSAPNRKEISEIFQSGAYDFLKRTGKTDFSGVTALNAMDEPGLEFSHLENCEICRAGWKKYLESLGISGDSLVLTNDPTGKTLAERKSYYYTRCYLNHIMTEMLRTGTQCAADSWKYEGKYEGKDVPKKTSHPVPVTVNFATETVAGNMVSRGLNWFEIFGTGALTYGWSEDWGGWNRTFQTNGYLCDVLRSACRQAGHTPRTFGIYNVLGGRSSWEIQAKGFMEIGHGVRAVSFFNYGPDYAISSDTNSERPEIYDAIKRVTFAAGAVESVLTTGAPVRADAAELHCVTGEIWHAAGDYAGGRERVDLNLLLRHCGISCDVLSESDLEMSSEKSSPLEKYKVLFACDSHMRRECVPALVSWVKKGGILYASPGALEFDEFSEPLGLWEQLGVSRPEFILSELPGRPMYEMRNRKEVASVEGIRAICGTQGEPCAVTPCEKGRVFCIGFFPAMSYVAAAEVVPQNVPVSQNSILRFPSEPRDFLKKILVQMNLRPRIYAENPLVEANFIVSPAAAADVIVLSNWTGEECETEITLENAPEYRSVRVVCGKLTSEKRTENGSLILRVRLAAGDYVLCEK